MQLSDFEYELPQELIAQAPLADRAARRALSAGSRSSIAPNSTVIRGPTIIGEQTRIVNSYVGPFTSIYHDVRIEDSEIEHSIVLEHSVVVVEHDMDFVRALNSRITVLHQGSVLAEGNMDQVQNDPRVVEVYLGE